MCLNPKVPPTYKPIINVPNIILIGLDLRPFKSTHIFLSNSSFYKYPKTLFQNSTLSTLYIALKDSKILYITLKKYQQLVRTFKP